MAYIILFDFYWQLRQENISEQHEYTFPRQDNGGDSVNAGNGGLLQAREMEIAELKLLLATQQQQNIEANARKENNWIEAAKQLKASQANNKKHMNEIRRAIIKGKEVSEEDKADKKQQARELEKGVCLFGGGGKSITKRKTTTKTAKPGKSTKKAKFAQTKGQSKKGKDAAKKQATTGTDKQPPSEVTDKQVTTDVDPTKKASTVVVSFNCYILSTVAHMSSVHVPIVRGMVWLLMTNMRLWKFVITGGVREVNLSSRFTTNPRAEIMRILRSGLLLLLPWWIALMGNQKILLWSMPECWRTRMTATGSWKVFKKPLKVQRY